MRKSLTGVISMFLFGLAAMSCDQPLRAAAELPEPAADLAAPEDSDQQRTAVFAAGCFWCVEAVFEQLNGVSDVQSGYAGDTAENANYEKVSAGQTKHAEAIQITYDPAKITYGQLLRIFFATHDPTTKDRQGPDWGHQYRSAIFYENDEQKRVAEAYIQQLEESKVFAPRKIVTTLEPLEEFYPAETYHQDFARENPAHPYIQQWAVPKLKKLRETYPEQVEPK